MPVFPGHEQTSSPCTLHTTRNSEADGIHRSAYLQGSYVHVKPHVVLLTDICDLVDGVEGAVDGGAGGGVHIHGNIPLKPRKGYKEAPFLRPRAALRLITCT